MLSASKIPMQDVFRGFEVQTSEGFEGSGRPESPRVEQESSDLPSLAWKTFESNSTHTLLYYRGSTPSYLCKDLNKGVMRNVSRFRLHATA
eukprot:53669-Pelagomonas_calceolata.AAC.1